MYQFPAFKDSSLDSNRGQYERMSADHKNNMIPIRYCSRQNLLYPRWSDLGLAIGLTYETVHWLSSLFGGVAQTTGKGFYNCRVKEPSWHYHATFDQTRPQVYQSVVGLLERCLSRLQTESNTNNHLKIGLSLYQQTACGSHGNLNSTNYVVFVLFSSRFLPLSPQSCAMCEVKSQTKNTPLPIFPCGETGTLLNHSSLPFFTSFSLAFSSLLLLHLYFLLCEENISSPVFFFYPSCCFWSIRDIEELLQFPGGLWAGQERRGWPAEGVGWDQKSSRNWNSLWPLLSFFQILFSFVIHDNETRLLLTCSFRLGCHSAIVDFLLTAEFGASRLVLLTFLSTGPAWFAGLPET